MREIVLFKKVTLFAKQKIFLNFADFGRFSCPFRRKIGMERVKKVAFLPPSQKNLCPTCPGFTPFLHNIQYVLSIGKTEQKPYDLSLSVNLYLGVFRGYLGVR